MKPISESKLLLLMEQGKAKAAKDAEASEAENYKAAVQEMEKAAFAGECEVSVNFFLADRFCRELHDNGIQTYKAHYTSGTHEKGLIGDVTRFRWGSAIDKKLLRRQTEAYKRADAKSAQA
jgi:hypothetical protein